MIGRIVFHPDTGQSVHVGGCRRPAAGHPKAAFAQFLTREFPAIPETCRLTTAAAEPLAQMWGNDTTGDCVPAAIFRSSAVKLCAAGAYDRPYVVDDVWAFYSGNTGYMKGDPSTDQGSDPVQALRYAAKNGLLPDGSHKIVGFIAVDGADALEVRRAIWLFEGVMATAELPDGFVSPPPSGSGFMFDVCGESNPQNGHGFLLAPKYRPGAVAMSTWGMVGEMTDAAVAKYCDGVSGAIYVALTRDQLEKAKTKAPNGLWWGGLEACFRAMGGAG